MKSFPRVSSSWKFLAFTQRLLSSPIKNFLLCHSERSEESLFSRLSQHALWSTLLLLLGAAFFLAASFSFARPQDNSSGQARSLFLDTRPTDNNNTPSKSAGKSGHMGLGYTLFTEKDGASKRVSPDHVFHSGDRVRILVETNRDVYLYVFHQEGPGAADLLFPDARLHGGENRVSAHKPSFIPHSSWFVFDNQAGDEKLTLVASEKPLEGVPRSSDLKTGQAFQMPSDSLAQLVAKSLPALQDAQADDGKPLTANENKTATEGTRGLTLSMNDPPPSHLVVNKTTQSGWITAQVTLTHR